MPQINNPDTITFEVLAFFGAVIVLWLVVIVISILSNW